MINLKIKQFFFILDFKLKCSICNEKFKTLNDLCVHKDNEACKEKFDHILTIENDNDEAISVDDELFDDSDDLDLENNFNNQNNDPEKKRTRRKYTKNKNNGSSNLICECKMKFFSHFKLISLICLKHALKHVELKLSYLFIYINMLEMELNVGNVVKNVLHLVTLYLMFNYTRAKNHILVNFAVNNSHKMHI